MFQFPAFALRHRRSDGIAPAGLPHSEIRGYNGYLPLTAAFRSLSRPSSPPRAQASPMRPFHDLFFFQSEKVSCLKTFSSLPFSVLVFTRPFRHLRRAGAGARFLVCV